MTSWIQPVTGDPALVAGVQVILSTYSAARRWNSGSFDGVFATALRVFPSTETFTMKIGADGVVVEPAGAASRVGLRGRGGSS
jgi:hypothetical protein